MILSDIDGTVLNVEERMRRCLKEAGVDDARDPTLVLQSLRGRARDRFYRLFQSDRYTELDSPVPGVIEQLKALANATGLEIVFLSGRISTMRKATRKALAETGLPYSELILRPRPLLMKHTPTFKVDIVREKGLQPVHVLDDDPNVLAAFHIAFPGAVLHQIGGRRHSPAQA